MADWNPWHGCKRISDGCKNCYVYRSDERYGRDATEVKKTLDFDLPVRRNRAGDYKITSGSRVYTCFSSDFLLNTADEWRADAWDMIRERRDLDFFFITKRIFRFAQCAPDDWGDGWDNVGIGCTCENQAMADYRLPIFLSLPIKHRTVICEPLLCPIELSEYLSPGSVEQLVAGGESGEEARPCDYEWILSLRDQCAENGVSFWFKQTGARFIKDGRQYRVKRQYQHAQARKAGINITR